MPFQNHRPWQNRSRSDNGFSRSNRERQTGKAAGGQSVALDPNAAVGFPWVRSPARKGLSARPRERTANPRSLIRCKRVPAGGHSFGNVHMHGHCTPSGRFHGSQQGCEPFFSYDILISSNLASGVDFSELSANLPGKIAAAAALAEFGVICTQQLFPSRPVRPAAARPCRQYEHRATFVGGPAIAVQPDHIDCRRGACALVFPRGFWNRLVDHRRDTDFK